MQSLSAKRPTPARRRLASLAPLALSLAACGTDQVSLGTGDSPLEGEAPELCPDGIAHGNFELSSQEQVDALSGCEVIAGNLGIIDTPALDLKPLRSIRVVRDDLWVHGDEQGPGGPIVDSLEGLESVEQVGRLVSAHLMSDLAPLANLTQVRRDPLSVFAGDGIEIYFSGIEDLTGLENLVDWNRLFLVGNNDLESLRGLTVRLGDQEVHIQHAPRLRDLAGLGGATQMHSLWLWNTAIENFDGVQLEVLGDLELRNSPRLTSLNGLSQSLRSIGAIILHDNDQLEELPALPSNMYALSIAGNDNLRSIQPFRYWDAPVGLRMSLGTPFSKDDSRTTNSDEVPLEFLFMELGNNPLLGEVHLPARFSSGSYVGIYDNPSLARLGLGAVENVDRLAIRNNANLKHIDMPALKRADDLDVRDNPNLSTATFDAVQTFSRDMAGNLEAPAP